MEHEETSLWSEFKSLYKMGPTSLIAKLHKHYTLPVGIILGIFIGLGLFYLNQRFERNVWDLQFDRHVTKREIQLEKYLEIERRNIQDIRSFFLASTKVTRDEFNLFVQSKISNQPYIHGLEWVPLVKNDEKEQFILDAKSDGLIDFQIKELNDKGELVPTTIKNTYFPILYMEPYETNEMAIGFDLASDDNRRKALENAARSGRPTVLTGVNLVPSHDNGTGMLLIVPLYDGVAASMKNRIENLRGFAVGAYHFRNMISSIFDLKEDVGFKFTIEDLSNNKIIFGEEAVSPMVRKETSIKYGETILKLNWTANDYFLGGPSKFLSYVLAIIGFLVCFLVSIVIQTISFSMEKANEQNKQKSEFLAKVSHEIRTPLTVIIGYTDILVNSPQPEGSSNKSFFEIIQRNAKHLSGLIDEVLDLSKIETGEIFFDKINFNLIHEIETIKKSFEVIARKKKIKFEVRYNTEVPEIITSDPKRFRQIIFNVLDNAFKFTENGKVTLEIGSYNKGSSKSQYLSFKVTDTGVGIGSENFYKIFQPFSQADNSISREFGGSGLGLAISRKFARMLGGNLKLVSSILGKGSIFEVSIKSIVPENTLIVNPNTKSTREDQGSRINNNILSGINVLIVEDEPDIQEMFKAILQNAGANVSLASSGTSALSEVDRKAFDVVLMDIQMPGIDGCETTKRMREKGIKYSIIALSAHALPGYKVKALMSGCDDFYAKPISAEKLASAVLYWSKNNDREIGLVS